MIRLTDEEIINLVTEYHFSGKQNRHILAKKVAQVQLKKVANLLNECCAGLDLKHPEYYENQDFVVFPVKYLKALLKEVEAK